MVNRPASNSISNRSGEQKNGPKLRVWSFFPGSPIPRNIGHFKRSVAKEIATFNDDTEVRSERPLIETRLLRCLRAWRVDPDATVENGNTLFHEICGLLEFYICGCIPYGPKNLGGWWSDGVIYLEIAEPHPDRFKLLGVTWIDSLGISPFEIDLELDPHDDKYFAKTVFRIGMLDNFGRPTVCRQNLAPTRVLENRPQYNRDWAMAVELTPPT